MRAAGSAGHDFHLGIPLREFLRDEHGQAATEYILVIGLVVIPLAIAFNKLSGILKEVVNRIAKLMYGPGV
jgi:Flp pilus assembly pilin Flp